VAALGPAHAQHVAAPPALHSQAMGGIEMAYPQTSPEQLQTATTPLSGVTKRTTADRLARAHTPQAGSHAHHAQAPHSPEPPTGPGVRSKLFIASCHQPCGGPKAAKASHDTAATLVRAQYTATKSQLDGSCAHAGCTTTKAGPSGRKVVCTHKVQIVNCTAGKGTATPCVSTFKTCQTNDTRHTQCTSKATDTYR
jgi:nitrite reductase/ring-hydroxylating ferredoxin subunit